MVRSNNRRFLALTLVLVSSAMTTPAQDQKPDSTTNPSPTAKKDLPQKRVTATDSIVVGAHLTPDEIEDGKINDVYQPLYHWASPKDCQQIVKLCETQIIPMAERSKFEMTRNKFLYLANRAVAGCEMNSGQYAKAEERYQKMFDFISIWPGKSDSDYPMNYRSIGAARIMQGRWKEAEEVLEKSLEIFGEQIERALHSDLEFTRNEESKNLKMSDARARNLLATAYFWDGRQPDAMEMLEKAYQEATQSSAGPDLIQQIIDNGRTASSILGDTTAKSKWNSRVPVPK